MSKYVVISLNLVHELVIFGSWWDHTAKTVKAKTQWVEKKMKFMQCEC